MAEEGAAAETPKASDEAAGQSTTPSAKAAGATVPSGIAMQAAGAERVREAAKWLIGIFAAIGGVLVAGMQLSSLGALEGERLRLGLALGSAFVALFGIALSIWFLLNVMMPSAATLVEDGDFDVRHREAFRGYANSRTGLRSRYIEALEDRRDKLRGNWAVPPTMSDLEASNANRLVQDIGSAVNATVAMQAYENLEGRMTNKRGAIIGGGAIAAAAIVLFAWAANPPAGDTAQPATSPAAEAGSTSGTTSMVGANLTNADLTGSTLTGADLHGATLIHSQLVGAVLVDADLRDADLEGANMTNANLEGALLMGTNRTDVVWANTICPDGELSGKKGCDKHLGAQK